VLSLLTIAIAWIFYRPLLAITIIVVIAGIIAFAIYMIKKRKPATA
jgi:uncharacterized membrane protein YsdA (DUF1294 family)